MIDTKEKLEWLVIGMALANKSLRDRIIFSNAKGIERCARGLFSALSKDRNAVITALKPLLPDRFLSPDESPVNIILQVFEERCDKAHIKREIEIMSCLSVDQVKARIRAISSDLEAKEKLETKETA